VNARPSFFFFGPFPFLGRADAGARLHRLAIDLPWSVANIFRAAWVEGAGSGSMRAMRLWLRGPVCQTDRPQNISMISG
jgi:hypothetical protein